jgi:hypothetical protein
MAQKLYTVEEANALLPVLDQELRTLQGLKRQFEQKVLELRRLKEKSQHRQEEGGEDPFFMLECEIEFMQVEARGLIQNFSLKGVELKDIDIGLVDFPAVLNGREVLLCWRQGEERISYYHSRFEGYAGRKSIPEE